jgi:hypothetical protein
MGDSLRASSPLAPLSVPPSSALQPLNRVHIAPKWVLAPYDAGWKVLTNDAFGSHAFLPTLEVYLTLWAFRFPSLSLPQDTNTHLHL